MRLFVVAGVDFSDIKVRLGFVLEIVGECKGENLFLDFPLGEESVHECIVAVIECLGAKSDETIGWVAFQVFDLFDSEKNLAIGFSATDREGVLIKMAFNVALTVLNFVRSCGFLAGARF